MVKVVLDTDVVVAGVRSNRGASFQWMLAALERRVTLLLSVPLCLEYEAVLTRSEHLRATRVGAADMRRLVASLVAVAEPVEIRFLWRPDPRDPDDAKVLEVAINGRADWPDFQCARFGCGGSLRNQCRAGGRRPRRSEDEIPWQRRVNRSGCNALFFGRCKRSSRKKALR